MMTEVFSFCRRNRKCPINQGDPAAIPDARNSLCRVKSFVRIIWSGAVTGYVEVQPLVGMMPAGRKPGLFSCNSIRYVPSVRLRERSSRRLLWIISSLTGATRFCSGIRPTGSRSVKSATIRKLDQDYSLGFIYPKSFETRNKLSEIAGI